MNPAAMIDYQSARLNMVESQVRPNKVTDFAVLDAMLEVPRERFVPEHLRGVAYVDEDVSLGGGRCLIEPMVFGRMLQLAAIAGGNVVLDVGCATGYSSTVLARLAAAGRRSLHGAIRLSQGGSAVSNPGGATSVAAGQGRSPVSWTRHAIDTFATSLASLPSSWSDAPSG